MTMKKSDWEAASRELLAEGRRRLGEPPGADELLAWSRGTLSAEDSARIQEFLVYYPELARTLAAPFPALDEIPAGSPEDLSEAELDQDWTRLRERIVPPSRPAPSRPANLPARALRTWRASTLAAAALAAVFAGLFLNAQLEVRRLTREVETPQVDFSRRVLLPDQQRAAGPQQPILLSADADHFLLKPSLTGARGYPDYRLDLVNLNRPKPERIWSASGLRLRDDQTFEIWVPRAFLRSGDYRFEIHGLAAGKAERLATYTVRLGSY
jgi:hypothetical protein